MVLHGIAMVLVKLVGLFPSTASNGISASTMPFVPASMLMTPTASSPFPASARKAAADAKTNLCPMNFIAEYYTTFSRHCDSFVVRTENENSLRNILVRGLSFWVFECLSWSGECGVGELELEI